MEKLQYLAHSDYYCHFEWSLDCLVFTGSVSSRAVMVEMLGAGGMSGHQDRARSLVSLISPVCEGLMFILFQARFQKQQRLEKENRLLEGLENNRKQLLSRLKSSAGSQTSSGSSQSATSQASWAPRSRWGSGWFSYLQLLTFDFMF